MFARLATAFSREGGDNKGLGATNEKESPGQRDAANVPNVEYTLTEAFPPLQSDTAIEQQQTTACTPDSEQAPVLPPKANANTVDAGARSKGASSNPSTPPPSSPILQAQQEQQYSADDKSQQPQQLQQHKPAPYYICICPYNPSQGFLLLLQLLLAAPLPTHARLFAESVTTRSACSQSLPFRHTFGLSAQQKGDRHFKGVAQDKETPTALARLQRLDRIL
ncbi:uncharacterized protein PG986_007404 [Apiospora aurea]|uniref:Uncharacterized protein n=1 Tax=Apiospora aurea TaxID=335848 RepID=A0ABR1QD89_9PEZI